MSVLFIVGNTNQYTFANAILAAHTKALERNESGLTDIFVLHSEESEYELVYRSSSNQSNHNLKQDSTLNWRSHLHNNGINPEIIAPFTVNLKQGEDALERAACHIHRCLISCDRNEDIYIDLTNGTSLYKNILSNIAYLIGIPYQFILDSPKSKPKFLSPNELKDIYVELPNPTKLDSIAPSWLTEIRRFDVRAQNTTQILSEICGEHFSQSTNFEGNIKNALQEYFKSKRKDDGSALGGAVRYIGSAFEETIDALYKIEESESKSSKIPLSAKINSIVKKLQDRAFNYEPQLSRDLTHLRDIVHLLLELRNASTHEKTSPDFGKIRARLSTELLFIVAEYFNVLHSHKLLAQSEVNSENIKNAGAKKFRIHEGILGRKYYFGLDGDDTGEQLEKLFRDNVEEKEFSNFSNSISNATNKIQEKIKDINGKILFCTGDDILFKTTYQHEEIENLREIYSKESGGLTCSIGFGPSVREAYVALKMAKAYPGKNRIVGIELVSE
jgi:hypothetical protein